eukprot:1158115-Prymnesium_polylepis.1
MEVEGMQAAAAKALVAPEAREASMTLWRQAWLGLAVGVASAQQTDVLLEEAAWCFQVEGADLREEAVRQCRSLVYAPRPHRHAWR